ncbi:SIS domain-containing protein, partial [candidate division KSB1 bacterium]|nr:SIS domain-containing protein [candidate division KSB1 bacterium]
MKPKLLHQLPENVKQFLEQHPDVVEILVDFMERAPQLQSIISHLIQSYMLIVNSFDNGGKLFLCGNGGSFADSLHISGEMLKSFQRNRKLKQEDQRKFLDLPDGKLLADALEYGLPVIVLGLNHSLKSAVENDIPVPSIGFAQELFALGKKDDVLLGISTSGNAQNVLYAITTAHAIGMKTMGLTGQDKGKLAQMVDIPLRVPAHATHRIQELHLQVYHTLCAIV